MGPWTCPTIIRWRRCGPGDLFGEMTCISLYPRSATVRASTDCVMFEMLRNVLDIIQRNKTLKAQLDAKYRQARAGRSSAQRADVRLAEPGVHRCAAQ